ncbi:MAG: dihydroorotate dehydrogenase electron transfer subunit [Chloroflexota bacterium]|nr:dihydroorotate dehydrogenase electron transfer subunit [Chloroflexota bacterium]
MSTSGLRLERARVLEHDEIAAGMFLMWLSCPAVARGATSGRFLMIHCSDSLDPLLPRPMSFHRFRQSAGEWQFAILYDVRGRGTAWLAGRKPGDEITVFGPLGRGYDLASDAQNVLLVAGGMGVAAVIALADEAIAAGRSVTLLQGARTAGLLFPHSLLPTDVEAVSATDDGSAGYHGLVTGLLAEHLPWADRTFACGPNPMFASMADVVKSARSRKPVQALLEERMGCGTGVCYGCAVFTRKGVRLVCRDGPRFDLREVFA